MPARKPTRRQFVQGAAAAGVGFWVSGLPARAQSKSPSEKLNVAGVGVGGQGSHDINQMSRENIVALCDVDAKRAGDTFKAFDKAAVFQDYRKMLDKMEKEIDAVVVATPDHMHAPISLNAMRRGKHVYCEKPLTWCAWEAHEMARVAKEMKVATQMGNHGSANSGFREGVEKLQAGVLGEVTELHIWTNRPVWPQAVPTPEKPEPVPPTLDWDLWLGVAPWREHHSAYYPFAWRGWYDFGTGALGDMACHTVNLVYRGLKLTEPTKIEAWSTKLFKDSYPKGAKITFHYPAREGLPPVKMVWYEGKNEDDSKVAPPDDILPENMRGKIPGSGCLAIGTKGKMFSPDDYGARQDWYPEEIGKVEVPRTIPRVSGHHAEWIAACKGGPAAYSDFSIAGPFTASMVLGNLAVRLGKTIEWDSKTQTATNAPDAAPLVKRLYRKGYEI